ADAVFLLQRQGRRGLFFVEVDLGSEVIGHPRRGVGRLVRFYLHAFATGQASALIPALASHGAPELVRALVITTSAQRMENVRRHWGARPFRPEAAKRALWLGTFGALHHGDLLTTPWNSLDPCDTEPYVIAASRQR